MAWIGAPGDRLLLSVQSPELHALLLAVPVATLIETHRASGGGDVPDLKALVEGSALPSALLWLLAAQLSTLRAQPTAVLQRQQCEALEQALLDGASPQVACSSAGLGFTDHTAKAFRDLYGHTPRDLRCPVAAGRADPASFLAPYPASRTWLLLSRINGLLECERSAAQPCDPAPLSTSRPS